MSLDKNKAKNHFTLNFPEKDGNKLYQDKTDLFLLGCLRIQLSENNEKEYAFVMACKIRDKKLTSSKLSNNELLYLLEKTSKKMINQQIGDLQYIVLNSYDSLVKTNFF